MEFQRLVGIAADEREAVRALDFKGGEMSVEQARLRREPEKREQVVELVDEVEPDPA